MTNSSLSNSQPEVGNPNHWLRAEVEHLLGKLRSMTRKNAQPIDPLRQHIYDKVFPYFESTALEYVSLAEWIIPGMKAYPTDYCYGQVLREITEHVRLLLSIRSGDVPLEPQSLQKSLDAIQAIIWHISQYLPNTSGERPILVPILYNRFMYFHLNYVNGVGIIGVPPDALVRPHHNLAILWHEAAGYWVAQQAANASFLKKQALILKKKLDAESVWDYYRDMYKRSLLHRLPMELDINDGSLKVSGITALLNYFAEYNPKSRETTIDTDLAWQQVWLGQILADLFGVQALGDTMAKSLRSALSRAYAHQDLGDLHHPPPSLRIEVAHQYLEANQVSALEHKRRELNAVQKLAEVIVNYVRTAYPEMTEMAPPNDGIVTLVKHSVQATLHPQNVQHDVDKLITSPAIEAAFRQSQAKVPSIKRSNSIWSQAGFTQSERAKFTTGEQCCNDVEAQSRIAQLLSIKFTKTDGNETQTPSSSTDIGQPLIMPIPQQGPPLRDS